jgi:DNA-binding LacI/PurR family transcriptional regulator
VTRHLLDLGHRRIAAITGPRDWQATEERRRGYHAALASAGILPDSTLEIEADVEIAGAACAAQALLDRPDPPTAIFAFNDNLAIGTIQAAHAHGLRVPEDLSVVGFDAASTPRSSPPRSRRSGNRWPKWDVRRSISSRD